MHRAGIDPLNARGKERAEAKAAAHAEAARAITVDFR